MFFNELDLLEIRLNELNDVVDKFIICESTRTFSNKPKELILEANKDRFKKFWHKIEYVIADESVLPYYDAAWTYENFQRDVMANNLKNCNPEDIIIISDLDEIPKTEIIKKLSVEGFEGIKILEMNQYNFYLNYINTKETVWKRGTRVFHYKDLGEKTLTNIRIGGGEFINNAGWHFSFLGGIEKVKYKIDAFAHQEYNNEYYTDVKRLEKAIREGKDIFERGYEYDIVPVDKSFPEYIVKNKDNYTDLILKEPSFLNKLLKKSKNLFKNKKYIETYKTSSENPLFDFITPNVGQILEIYFYDNNLSAILSEKHGNNLNKIQLNSNILNKINEYRDSYFDCVIFNDCFSKISEIEEILEVLKKKMNVNGYIIADVPNIRYFAVLQTLLNKKLWDFHSNNAMNKTNKRFYTRKSIENLIYPIGYFFITFKGICQTTSITYKIWNIITFGNLYDSKHEKFLCVFKY